MTSTGVGDGETSDRQTASPGRRQDGRLLALALAVSAAIALAAVVISDRRPERVEPADAHNGQIFVQDNLWSTETEQYAVWVGRDGTPYAGKRDRGGDGWDVADLSQVTGNPLGAPTADDLHNVYAIAVDSAGYVHVAGNMHDVGLRYVRSTAPGDIHHWERATMPAPIESVTYPRFVGLPDGTLQFWHREGYSGEGTVVMHVLDAATQTWNPGTVVVDGRPSGESPYPHHIAVDPRSGAIHLLFEWRGEGDVASTNDVGYARSIDGGTTWQTSAGMPLTLPVTHDTAEVVVDTEPTGSGLVNDGGLAIDGDGRLHALLLFATGGIGPARYEHVWLDGTTWHRETAPIGLAGRPAVAVVDGRVVALGSDGDGMLTVVDIGHGWHRRRLAEVPAHWEATVDSQAILRHGELETLVPDGDQPRVVEVDLP